MSSSIHERAIESLRRKIGVLSQEIDFSRSKMTSLPNKHPEKAVLALTVKEKENKVCGCKDALRIEEKLMSAPYPPGIIGTVTDFGFCFPIGALDIRSNKNPNWYSFDSFIILEKYYTPVIDAYQQGIETGKGGLYNTETEGMILDTGQVTSYLWVSSTLRKLSNPGARINMPIVPSNLLHLRREKMPKVLKIKKRNRLTGNFTKPSYDIPLIKAFNMRFDWAEFAECNRLDPEEPLMKMTNLWNIHHPELARTGYRERDEDAAYIIEEATRKEAKITLKQKGFKYSKPFHKRIVGSRDPLTYHVQLPNSTSFIVDSPDANSKTTYSLGTKPIGYEDALGLIEESWKKELERKKTIREMFRGRF